MNTSRQRHLLLLASLAALLASGCASINAPYKPGVVGPVPDQHTVGGLEVTITTDQSRAQIGDLLNFRIRIKNVGTTPVSLPESPDILLTWVYPDGKCDNFVRDEADSLTRGPMITLAPGAERSFRTTVTTHYFAHLGITEFRACLRMPQGQSSGTDLAWSGDVTSNGYGVLFAN